MAILLKWLVPWEFSWVFLASFFLACVLYWRGSRRVRVSRGRKALFWIGMAIIWITLQT